MMKTEGDYQREQRERTADLERQLAEANARLEAVSKIVDDTIGAGRGRTFATYDPNGIFADAMIEINAVLEKGGE